MQQRNNNPNNPPPHTIVRHITKLDTDPNSPTDLPLPREYERKLSLKLSLNLSAPQMSMETTPAITAKMGLFTVCFRV
jgi:hypothetical protein